MTDQTSNRQRVLEQALRLFSAHSYHTVSVDEIARAAGVSKGGLFHHFASKMDLASAALIEGVETQWAGMCEAAAAIDDPAQRMKVALGFWVDAVLGMPSVAKLALDLWPELMKQPDVLAGWMPAFRRMETTVAEWLAACGVPGPEIKAMILIAAIDDLSIQASILGDENPLDAETIADELYELFVGNYVDR